MNPSNLTTGDILLFERGTSHGTFVGRCIRLITGSKFTHCALVLITRKGEPMVLEQDGKVTLKPLSDYTNKTGISVWRNPKITWEGDPVMMATTLFLGLPYGDMNLAECLWKHLVDRLDIKARVPLLLDRREIITTCAGLIANMLMLCTKNPPAFSVISTVAEPDDFSTNGYVRIGDLS